VHQSPRAFCSNRPSGLSTLSLRALLVAGLATPPSSFALTKQKFDFVVGVNGDAKAGLAAAKVSSRPKFILFFPDGEYDLGSLTGDANQMTTFSGHNVSFIGQSSEKTVLFNKSINEGISITATLLLKDADNLYMQDMTIFNKAVYGNTAQYNTTGRHVAIQEQSDKVIYRNVKLKSTQDTYYTKGTRTYWEGGEIHGTTDFICGGGDVFFNKVKIWEMKVSAITASQSNSTWGYVFKDCIVDGTVSGFTLGRSWGDARVVFLNATMNKLPSEAGWGDPMNSVPKVFAEYKSVTSSGTAVDLSKRRKSYTKDATTVTLNPILSDAEAAKYTVANVLSGSDNWQPQVVAAQAAAPIVSLVGTTLKWDDNDNALCWAVFKNGKYMTNVVTNGFDFSPLSSVSKGDTLSVRAANSMGGLGATSNRVVVGSTSSVTNSDVVRLGHAYDRTSRTLTISGKHSGRLRASLHRLDGTLVVTESTDRPTIAFSLDTLKPGVYMLDYNQGGSAWAGALEVL
jgi:pectin methylesterase-like acyl-CoA thioesterase